MRASPFLFIIFRENGLRLLRSCCGQQEREKLLFGPEIVAVPLLGLNNGATAATPLRHCKRRAANVPLCH